MEEVRKTLEKMRKVKAKVFMWNRIQLEALTSYFRLYVWDISRDREKDETLTSASRSQVRAKMFRYRHQARAIDRPIKVLPFSKVAKYSGIATL